MIEPTGHCPFLGLKQNRAIRFAAPTPEHRCYVNGEPIEIPVDQASYCLAQGHVRCPLYMGLTLSTIGEPSATLSDRASSAPAGGVRGWLATLPRRDRAIYLLMLGLLLIIIAAYLLLGLRSLLSAGAGTAGSATATSAATAPVAPTSARPAPSGPAGSAAQPSPTYLPTSVPSPLPTDAPTDAPLLFSPTRLPETPTTAAPTTDDRRPPTAPPTTDDRRPTTAPLPPTSAPVASRVPSSVPPLASPVPSPVPPAALSNERLTLYFGDVTDTLYVPVQRVTQIENQQVARAAVRELLAGPRNGLQRLLLPNARLLDLTISGSTAVVNFDRRPTGAGDERGLYAVVLTLTQFQSIQQVQFQVGGQSLGAPISRPVVNPLNPQNLAPDVRQTEFLPLYFPSVDGIHDVRIIRMVPKTAQVAEATMRALLAGPGSYKDAVRRIIPASTELRGIRRDGSVITVDFTQPFADASERAAAVRSVALALTTLPNVTGVQFLVEGRSLEEFWGAQYGGVFARPVINGE